MAFNPNTARVERGFNQEYITGGERYNDLLSALPQNQAAPFQDRERLQQRAEERTYAQNQSLQGQADLNLTSTLQQADQAQENIKAQSLQRGIGLGAFNDLQSQQANENIAKSKAFSREAHRSIVGEERALNIEAMKTRISQQGMQTVRRKFVNDMQNFQRKLEKYNKTTAARFGQEYRATQERKQAESESAWKKLTIGMHKNQKGGEIAGGIVGGIAGAIAAAYTGNVQFISGGIQTGKGVGSGIGTLAGTNAAYRQIGY